MVVGASDPCSFKKGDSFTRHRSGGTIDSKTLLYAVIGDPVAHSLGPLMHNAAFGHTGYNGVYVALRVTDPIGAVAGIRALGLAGISVTIPHKRAVIDHLDRLDPTAEKIGAVNTIVNRNGVLTGYNTDGAGAVRALAAKTPLDNRRVVVIGAGGTARAIGHAVTEQGARLTIVNRSIGRGRSLARDLGADFRPLPEFSGDACDVLINTTPVGMVPDTAAMVVSETVLRPRTIVMDVVYNPLATRLLRTADRMGCTTIDGVDMFVYQGAAQFEMWTGVPAPVKVMRQVVEGALAHSPGDE